MKILSRQKLYNKIIITFKKFFLALVVCILSAAYPSGKVEAASLTAEESAGAVPPVETEPDGASADDRLVVVIDPGHGGTGANGAPEGGVYDGLLEKEMTLITAKAMKEELEKYEGVEVYLTREGDQKLSLAERVNYAKSVDADFLFCLHYNLSEDHNTLFGAECWVSAFGKYYSEGHAFADIEMEALETLGLYSRGIKTRLNDRGTDYYGIIRQAVEKDLTCVLIEHCHMDHENDRPFCEGEEQWETLGRLDADSAARYFRLKSDILGVDYSDYQVPDVPVPENVMRPDTTKPDVCLIEVTDQQMETGEITVELSAADYDSGLLYYDYSFDGGETYSPMMAWEDKARDTITFTMQAPPHIIPQIVVRVYNGYDLFTQSNLVSLPSMDYKTEEEIAAEAAEKEQIAAAAKVQEAAKEEAGSKVKEETEPEKQVEKEADREAEEETERGEAAGKNTTDRQKTPAPEEEKEVSVSYFITVSLVCALSVAGMTLSMVLITQRRKRRRRGRRRGRRR